MTGYLFSTSTWLGSCGGRRAIKSSGAGEAKGSGFSVGVRGLEEGFVLWGEKEEEGEVGRIGFWDRAGQ